MRVAVVQHDIVWEDPAANHERLAAPVAEAAGRGAQLVVLSEMFASGFSMNTDRVAEAADGPSTRFLIDAARAHATNVGGSIAIRDGIRVFNTFVVAAPDGSTSQYRKLHPFSYGREHEHYAPGHDLVTVTIDDARIALFVCYDLRFANQFWALAGHVDCFVITANWPTARQHHWRSLLIARAIENQTYVVACNRVGSTRTETYTGGSMIVDPLGEIVSEASDSETIVVGDIEPIWVSEVHAKFPFLADRRATLPVPQ